MDERAYPVELHVLGVNPLEFVDNSTYSSVWAGKGGGIGRQVTGRRAVRNTIDDYVADGVDALERHLVAVRGRGMGKICRLLTLATDGRRDKGRGHAGGE